MPSLAAKVYVQLGLVRDSREETLLKELVEANSYKSILSLLKPGTVVVNPLPIFKVISLEQTNALKVKYAGKNN
jgi:Methionyl-tRNA synthetase